jgi:Holliday junction DNA helicase RuvA
MIGRLTGTVVSEDADGNVVLDVHGVGYELVVPLGALGRAAAASDGVNLVLHVHTHVREDAFELFGFASEAERSLFRALLSVQKVGPKLAMAILSAIPPEDFAVAVRTADVTRLAKIPGIGKKTAERLVLELKDKIPSLALGRPGIAPLPAPTASQGGADRLMSALVNMGYRANEAERVVRSLGERADREPMAELLREALGALRRPGA